LLDFDILWNVYSSVNLQSLLMMPVAIILARMSLEASEASDSALVYLSSLQVDSELPCQLGGARGEQNYMSNKLHNYVSSDRHATVTKMDSEIIADVANCLY
jgi:hypothetical protein